MMEAESQCMQERWRQEDTSNFKAIFKRDWLLNFSAELFLLDLRGVVLFPCVLLSKYLRIFRQQQEGSFWLNVCLKSYYSASICHLSNGPEASLMVSLAYTTFVCWSVELSFEQVLMISDSQSGFLIQRQEEWDFFQSQFCLCRVVFGLNIIYVKMRSSSFKQPMYKPPDKQQICIRNHTKNEIWWPQINLMETALTASILVFYFRSPAESQLGSQRGFIVHEQENFFEKLN